MRNPFNSTGLVIRRNGDRGPVVAGTTFAFLSTEWFLTAHHVIKGVGREDLGIALYIESEKGNEFGLDVDEVHVHETADLALLYMHDWGLEIFDPFIGISDRFSLGDDVRSFGFPDHSTRERADFVPRMLRGSIQRHFDYDSDLGFSYPAIELSSPAPAGLSGAPVSLDSDQSRVIGLVAENFESHSLLHEISEVDDRGARFTERIHKMVNYGLAVDLMPFHGWLRHVISSKSPAV